MTLKHLSVALEEIGTAEVPGAGNNPRIVEYLTSVGLPGRDVIPHCAAYVNWVLAQVKIKGTGSGMARSYLYWGYEISKPRLGCIVVLRRGLNPKKGHVGFYLDHSGGFIRILGANQGDRVGINAYSAARHLSYRWTTAFSTGDRNG